VGEISTAFELRELKERFLQVTEILTKQRERERRGRGVGRPITKLSQATIQ